jgi:hypothetical protein
MGALSGIWWDFGLQGSRIPKKKGNGFLAKQVSRKPASDRGCVRLFIHAAACRPRVDQPIALSLFLSRFRDA